MEPGERSSGRTTERTPEPVAGRGRVGFRGLGRGSLVGGFAAVLLAVLYGSSYVATAFQLRGFSPIAGGFWRSLLAAGLLTLLTTRLVGRPRLDTAGLRHLTALAVLGGPMFILGMNLAVEQLGATVTAFVAGLYAILAAVFAPFFVSERLGRATLVGFIVAVGGTALLAGLAPSANSIVGLGPAVVAAVSFGLYLVLLRKWSGRPETNPILVSLAVSIGSALVLGLLVAATGPATFSPRDLGPEVVVSTLWLSLVAFAGPVLGTVSLRRIETRFASAMLLLNPITASLLAAVLLGERLSALQLVGGLGVLVGMGMATLAGRGAAPVRPSEDGRREAISRSARGARPE